MITCIVLQKDELIERVCGCLGGVKAAVFSYFHFSFPLITTIRKLKIRIKN